MAKILIVEDNALNIKLFCDLLAAHGHEPQAVTDSRWRWTPPAISRRTWLLRTSSCRTSAGWS